METKYTFCRICEASCGLEVDVDNNVIQAIRPDKEHVASQGYACSKGLRAHQLQASPDRLTSPMKRVNGRLEPVSWDQVLSEIGEKLKALDRTHGADSIGLYLGNPLGFSLITALFVKAFMHSLGSSKFYQVGSVDCNNRFAGSEMMYGSAQFQTFPDIDHTQFLMIIGGNPAVSRMSFISLPHTMKRIKAIEERGGKVIHINPRRTESAKQVGEHFFIQPDTDAFFLLAFFNEVINQKGVKEDLVDRHMRDFDLLVELARPWTAKKVAPVTGISEKDVKSMVTQYLACDGAALYLSTGVNQGTMGTIAFCILEAINAVTGNLDRQGGTLMGKGIVDVGKMDAKQNLKNKKLTHRLDPSVKDLMGTWPMGLVADDILTPGDGQLRAMFVVGGNPLLSCANSDRLAKAFAELELLVCIDIFPSVTSNLAHYVLPATHFLERPDLPSAFTSLIGLHPEPSVQYTDAVVKPEVDVKEEIWILRKLCEAAGKPFLGSPVFASAFSFGERLARLDMVKRYLPTGHNALINLVGTLTGIGGLGKLRSFPHGKKLKPHQYGEFLSKRIGTASGKIELASKPVIKRLLAMDEKFKSLKKTKGDIKLISRRERYTHNSWFHNDSEFLRADRHRNYCYINKKTATKQGLHEGQMAKVASTVGAVTLMVKIDNDLMDQVIAVTHGWGHQAVTGLSIASQTEGENVNRLADDGIDAIEPDSGMSQLNAIVVQLTPVGNAQHTAQESTETA